MRLRVAITVAAAAVVGLLAGPASGQTEPVNAPAGGGSEVVGVIGCSNTRNAIDGYHTVSNAGVMWPSEAVESYGGKAVTEWAAATNPAWTAFDAALAAHPNTVAIWWELCVRDGDGNTEATVDTIVDLLRQRVPDLPIYASPLDDTPSCTRGNPDQSAGFVDYLVANGDVLRGPTMTPLAQDETASDGCHANEAGMVIWGSDVADFFDGGLPPAPTPGTFGDVPLGHPFYDEITAIAEAGITQGCNPPAGDLYCPDDQVSRGQMAAFLNRALNLPAAPTDYFSDDAGSTFEADINAIAHAGITVGCDSTGTLYCPLQSVSRAQMASFLARALGLTAGVGSDVFVDDDGSVHEANIERIHAAGITLGCNPPANDQFCPDLAINRGQMAAFLARALNL